MSSGNPPSTPRSPSSSASSPPEAGPSRPSMVPSNSAIPLKKSAEKIYTGPSPDQLAAPRTRTQAEKYFARVANENVLPTRTNKLLGVGGWVLGGFACFYMALFADFGEREHVFSPVRRQYASLKQSFFTLSPSERQMMGVNNVRENENRPS
ncbi:uncharacterized protein I303_105570 [Kwoniella dejecticola CBS 10117]|uniref:Cytochrome c oxidase assembly factor 3 n=1 Tax=Kwoniella dejecticola CBS 10117 TaxID=1296121 RepID=A0A1A6A239_9TREE|nr:uncharacterized protein I303_04987 [Kwoniella dejecticola CBS 10117]OBR84130.1 hypothetical protein I303_04987 [Kwoniella dejecticola CBS 10117]